MDGGCINYAIVFLFIAKIYGISLSPAILVSLAVLMLLLTMGMPGIPGGLAIVLTPLLVMVGGPVEAIPAFLALDSILDMFRTVNNTTGDIAASIVIANSEGLIDKKVYYQK